MSQIEEIVAQLRSATETLDAASVTALRAEADARQAQARFDEAGTGSGHRDITAAFTESRTAAEKAAKVGRLIAEATRHIATYANTINPGSMPGGQASELATPSGEQLLTEAVQRESARRNVGSFLGTLTRKVEDVQDHTQKTVAAIRKATEFIRGPDGPSGSVKAGTTTPTVGTPAGQSPKIDAPEAAGHLVVVGLVAGVAIHRSYQSIRRGMSRLRKRERTD
ncbi:hypothetical protein AB0J86_09490 [Micromonospora sp. NPDC049559]|uniref:hypothetical protein n=1 Tax=Micromonospora sp. NPDC049559 TaxID=3155923 RepID=UPI00343366AF